MENIYETIKKEIWSPFNILNGREDLYSCPVSKKLNNNSSFYNENALNTISRSQTQNTLSITFFSKENIDIIQKNIIYDVYLKSNGKYKIQRQSDQELIIIMRSYYYQYAKNSEINIKEQIRELNKMVSDWSVNEIIKNIQQHDGYKESVSTLPMPLDRSQLTTQKGTKTLELKTFF